MIEESGVPNCTMTNLAPRGRAVETKEYGQLTGMMIASCGKLPNEDMRALDLNALTRTTASPGRELTTKDSPTPQTDLNGLTDVTAMREIMTKEVRREVQRDGHRYHVDLKWENLLEARCNLLKYQGNLRRRLNVTPPGLASSTNLTAWATSATGAPIATMKVRFAETPSM